MTVDRLGRAIDDVISQLSATGAHIMGTAFELTRAQHRFLHSTHGTRSGEVAATVADTGAAVDRLGAAYTLGTAAIRAIEEYCHSLGIPLPHAARAIPPFHVPTLPSHAGTPRPPTGERAGARTRKPQRGHHRENDSAALLAAYGYQIEQNPKGRENGKHPDYLVEGRYFDCYAPTTANPDEIRNKISDKVRNGQAERIILNLDECPVTIAEIQDRLRSKPVNGLQEVIAVIRSQVVLLDPWRREF
ncbi:hypothetical protein O7632_08030 [Solwaraspora sp. WMMD406]|uniref:CdiA C-terminal domain-containing protein n=1 Tax=Solwaraspora sp. WMMD406 TaxID=3016095 RepID=UPI0024179C82|nr:hypothetical protein [Solwaraspora sp. WMMD406]MDG4764053.1 hypothetical protein [Solwaraspora sp. WMMD406]